MGASVQPISGDKIAANVTALRSQGASDNDIEAYLKQEGIQPDQDTSLSLRNLGRSFVQGGTYGWGDEMGLTSRDKENAFKAQHPVADFLSKMVGGSVAPIAAMAAAPELLAGAGGAAILGGTTGALSGAGESEGSLGDRAIGAGIGGVLGAATGAAGYGAGKMVGKGASAVADRISPERTVRRAAAGLIDPSVKARLAQVDAIAPGGSSIATAAVPANDAQKMSRFLPMLRAIGANEDAGRTVESNLTSQKGALNAARKSLGAQMDGLNASVPVDPQVTSTLSAVSNVLGNRAPKIGANQTHIDVQDLRSALSELRFDARQAARQGVNANGVKLHDINTAKAALQSLVYDRVPQFAALDQPYAVASDELRSVQNATKVVQRSRANYSANNAYGATSGSLGGSLPSGRHGVAMSLLDNILTDRAGAADAVARLIAKPGGPALVDQILSNVPKAPGKGASKYVAPLTAGAIPALRGLLSPAQP